MQELRLGRRQGALQRETVRLEIQQELLTGEAQDIIDQQTLPAAIQQPATTLRKVLAEFFQTAQILRSHLGGVLYFQRVKTGFAVVDSIMCRIMESGSKSGII